ncbi:MAG: PD40 domain-containing protein [Bacteroidetes bacterium]|nr:PD40 domain-containing protein [Bacteroidota bacterium]
MKKIILSCLIILLGSINLFAQSNKVVYTSNQSSNGYLQIFTMNDDGSDKKQIITMEVNCVNPKWSHDGTKIVFATTDEQVYLIDNIETGDYRFMWKGITPAFTQTDDEIIFISDYEGVNSIYALGLEETEPFLLSDGNYSNQAILSANGNYMIYSAIQDGGKSIMLRDLNDTTDNPTRKISVNKDANLEPDISPDETKYVYAGFDMNLNGTIYLYENGKERALTKDIPSATQPKFSPDGSKIAFAVIKGERVKLYTMNADGTNKKDLGIKGGDLGLFKWADNNRIIYDAETESEQYSIGIVDISTGDIKLIATTGFNLHPDILNQ